MKRLTIIGASGHGKVVAGIAELCGYDDIRFLDDDLFTKECSGFPVIGDTNDAESVDGDLFIAVGNADIRSSLMERFSTKVFPVLVHPSAVIANNARIAAGTVVMAGAVINPDACIGQGCIVNTCASVDHDCVLGDYVHIAVGAHLCGTVTVGSGTWIGAGATVSNNVSVCSGCILGAGAVVTKDIDVAGTYVGVPARLVYSNKA